MKDLPMKSLVFTLLLSASLAGPVIAMEQLEPTQGTQRLHQVSVEEEQSAESYERRVFACESIVTSLLKIFQQFTTHPNQKAIQTYLQNSREELQKSLRRNDEHITSLLRYMSDLSIHLSQHLGVMFGGLIQDPFESYNAFILKLVKDKNDALALEEQYVNKKQKAPSWGPKELATYKEIISNFILILEEEEDRQKEKKTLNAQSRLKRSLTRLDEMSNEGAKPIAITNYLEGLISNVNYDLGENLISQTINKLIKLKPHEYGNFPASSKELDFLNPNTFVDLFSPKSPDLAKIKSSSADQIAELKSKALLPHISCWEIYWEDNSGSYRPQYEPTKSEKDEISEKSLSFFQNKENEGQSIFEYKFEKQDKYTKYKILCQVERVGKSALLRQGKISELKEKVKNAHDAAQNYGNSQLLKTASSMGNIVLDQSYTIQHYQDYVLNLLKIENLGAVNSKKIKILDIGAATGANDLKLVKMGATLVANDLERALPDLVSFRSRLTAKERENLWFNTDSFPDKFDQPEASFDAVLMSHIAHYLTGPQIRYGFKKIYKWLNPEGKLFFQAITPYSAPFSWRSKTVTSLKQTGNEWPGWFGQANKQLEFEFGNKSDANIHGFYGKGLPSFGHPIDPEILERELIGAGFEIEALFYSKLGQNFISPLTYKEHELYVMGDCENSTKTQTDATERFRLVAKIETVPGYKALIDEDRKKYCAKKLIMDKGGYPLSHLINVCLLLIDHFINEFGNNAGLYIEDKELALDTLQKARLTLLDNDSQGQNSSPEQIMTKLSEDLVQLLGVNHPETVKHTPLMAYYQFTGARDELNTMKSVQAIVKKPKQ